MSAHALSNSDQTRGLGVLAGVRRSADLDLLSCNCGYCRYVNTVPDRIDSGACSVGLNEHNKSKKYVCVLCVLPPIGERRYAVHVHKNAAMQKKGDFLKRNQCSEYTSGQSGAGTLHPWHLSGPRESAGTKRSLVTTVSLLNGREPPLPICRSALFYDRRLGRSTFIRLQKNNLLIATFKARENGGG